MFFTTILLNLLELRSTFSSAHFKISLDIRNGRFRISAILSTFSSFSKNR